MAKVLAEPHQPIERVYFPHSGIISYVVAMSDGNMIETGMVGRDGVMGGIQALDEKVSPNRIMVQVPGPRPSLTRKATGGSGRERFASSDAGEARAVLYRTSSAVSGMQCQPHRRGPDVPLASAHVRPSRPRPAAHAGIFGSDDGRPANERVARRWPNAGARGLSHIDEDTCASLSLKSCGKPHANATRR